THACVLATERFVFLRARRTGHALATEGIALATDNGFPSFLAFSRFYEALLDDGRASAARLAVMQDAIAERRRLGDRWNEALLFGLLAEAQLGDGDVAGALASLDAAEAHVARTDERYFEAELLRVRGACALAAGARGVADAVRCFRQAASRAREQGALLWR